MKKMFRQVAALLMATLLLAGMTACGQAEQETELAEKYTRYCGLCDADAGTQILTVEEAQEAARGIIVGKGHGYTETVAFGGYMDGDQLVENDTLVYELMLIDGASAEELATMIKSELNLDAILVEKSLSEQNFVE